MNDDNFIMLLNRVMSGSFSYEQKKALYLAARLRVMGQRPDRERDRARGRAAQEEAEQCKPKIN